ncbi:GM23511 [Drosophila sechellia]|uniref:GM23511 n=1 Tax=Drosophila sechellia TaxID=7238 RepID=B4IMH5_DROSE|nr:GM23511 [Drosophila sechellia]
MSMGPMLISKDKAPCSGGRVRHADSLHIYYVVDGKMTLLSNILDCGGCISDQRFTHLLRQSGSSGPSPSAPAPGTFESKSMLEPTSPHSLATGRVPLLHDFDASTTESPGTYVLDGVARVAQLALEPTVMDALPDPDTEQVLGNLNSSAPWNLTLASAAATNFENCSALFVNYTLPQTGLYCNWTWDTLLCWPPTPAGVLARMNCPGGFHGVDTRKFANRKCELDGRWGSRPNATEVSPPGWTDYGPCYKPEIIRLMQQMGSKDFDNITANKRLNGRKPSSASIVMIHEPQQRQRLMPRMQNKAREKGKDRVEKTDAEAEPDPAISRIHSKEAGSARSRTRGSKWIMGICFRGQKVLRVPSASSVPPESVVFELSEQ